MSIISPSHHNVRKGCYILVLTLKGDHTITVGRMGDLSFPAGNYAYVGSALGGLQARLRRHLSGGKRLHWHIDYLLLMAEIEKIIWTQTNKRIECQLARWLSQHFHYIPISLDLAAAIAAVAVTCSGLLARVISYPLHGKPFDDAGGSPGRRILA